MTIVRVLVGGVVIAFCAGFIPVGGCAKGCSQAGKAGAQHADDFARVGTRGVSHYGDDIARGVGRYGDDIARSGRYSAGRYGAVGGVAHGGEDMAVHLSRRNLETTLATLPEADGPIAALARKPTPSGAHLEGLDDAGRTFSKDYAKSVDDLALSEKQHEGLMDAFETAQDVAEELIEALVEDDEDETDKLVAAARAREQLQLVALQLEANVVGVLSPEQIRKFRAQFGSSEVVAYRLGKERPIRRNNDKVAP